MQEVLAQREFGIGRFYYLRQSYPAAIARLKTMATDILCYSGADQALYLLGQSYEGEIETIRKNPRGTEVVRSKMIEELTKEAAAAYSKIITRYPAMDRAVDAKARLEAMHQPVPRPTRKALIENQKEQASRQEPTMMSNVLGGFEKHPDVSQSAHRGDPTMVDPEPETATGVFKSLANAANGDGRAAS